MCCCSKPTVNGEPGYSWDGKTSGVRTPNPPDLKDGDTLLYDEPGRCGGIDSHSHHYRVVKAGGWFFLRVRHGGGEEEIRLRFYGQQIEALSGMDSNSRYWLLNAIYCAHSDAQREASSKEARTWREAVAEKRIKTRKYPSRGTVKVWIEPKPEARSNA